VLPWQGRSHWFESSM